MSTCVAENLAWLSEFYDAIAPHALRQAYQNFTDPSLKDYLHQYYGTNLPRLERVKCAVDPARVFSFPQAIPPAQLPVFATWPVGPTTEPPMVTRTVGTFVTVLEPGGRV